mgnify:CR=1 FL=1
MKIKTTISIFAFLLLIPFSACGGSDNTTDSTAPNIENTDTAVKDQPETTIEDEPETTIEDEPETTIEESSLLSPADIGEKFGDAVWSVSVEACGGSGGGSAFAIAPDIFITNQHVIGPDMTPTLISRSNEFLEGVVIGWHYYLDVAIVKTSEPIDTWLEWANPDDLREGDPVVSLGYPAPYYSFSVSPGTIVSFIQEGSSRIGVVSDEASDYGSSGGPLISDSGKVVGVVTNFIDDSGAQLNGESFSYSYLGWFIEGSIRDGTAIAESCDGYVYGTYAFADVLASSCLAGRYWACDSLFEVDLPIGGEYTELSSTCGYRVDTDLYCVDYFESPVPLNYGDDPEYLDGLFDNCANGDMNFCDALFLATDPYVHFEAGYEESEYYQFGVTCGYTQSSDSWCGSWAPTRISTGFVSN